MAKEEKSIQDLVKEIIFDDPKDLRRLVEQPYSFEALWKLRDCYTGKGRDKVINFVESMSSSYDVDYIKGQIDSALQSRSKMEIFFGDCLRNDLIVLVLSILYWIIFNLGTGILLLITLFCIFSIGYEQVNEISKQRYSGDTLRFIEDFKKTVDNIDYGKVIPRV